MTGTNYKRIKLTIKPFLVLCLVFNITKVSSQDIDTPIADTLENGFTYYIKPMENSGGKVFMDLIIRSGYNRQIEGQDGLAHFVEHLPLKSLRYDAYSDKGKLGNAMRSNSIYLNGSTTSYHTSFSYHFPSSEPFLRDKGLSFLSQIALGDVPLDKISFEAEKGAFYQEVATQEIGSNIFQEAMIRAKFSNCSIDPIFPDSLWSHIQNYNIRETQEFITKWYRPELSSLIIVGEIEDISELEKRIKENFYSSPKSPPITLNNCKESLTSYPPKFLVLQNQNLDSNPRAEVKFHFFIQDSPIAPGLTELEWAFIKPLLSQTINKFLWENLNYYNSHTLPGISWSSHLPVLDLRIKKEMGKEEKSIKETFKFFNLIKYKGITKNNWKLIHNQGIKALQNPSSKTIKHWQGHLKKLALGEKTLNAEEKASLLTWWENFTIDDFNFFLRKLINQDIKDFVVLAPISPERNQSYWRNKTLEWLSKNDIKLTGQSNPKKPYYTEHPSDIFGARVFILSNGQKIIIKEFSKNKGEEEFLKFHAYKNFGGSNFNDTDYHTALLAPEIIQNSGYGNLDKFELEDIFSSTSLNGIKTYITDTESGIMGNSKERDFTLFFELIEKYFNAPRKDSLAFKDWQMNKWREYLNPGKTREISNFNSQANKILKIPVKDLAVLEKFEASKNIDIKNAYKLYDSIYRDAHGFTFLISSSVKAEEILPNLVETFGRKAPNGMVLKKPGSINKNYRDSKINKYLILVSSIPNSNALLSVKYLKKLKVNDWKTKLHFQIITALIRNRIPQIRFLQNKAIYYSGITYINNNESNQFGISIVIPTLQEQANSIAGDINKTIKDLQLNNIKEAELKKIIKEKILPRNSNNWQKNPSKTLDVLYNYYRFNEVPPQKEELENYILSISPKEIKAAASKLLVEANRKEFIGLPKKKSN